MVITLFLAVLVTVIFSTIWVGLDARRFAWEAHGLPAGQFLWLLAVIIVWSVALPAYLFIRRVTPLRNGPRPEPSSSLRLALLGTLLVGFICLAPASLVPDANAEIIRLLLLAS